MIHNDVIARPAGTWEFLSLAQQCGWQLRFLAKDTPIYNLDAWCQ